MCNIIIILHILQCPTFLGTVDMGILPSIWTTPLRSVYNIILLLSLLILIPIIAHELILLG